MIADTLFSILRCPACRGLLAVARSLRCRDCGQEYPLQGRVPVLRTSNEPAQVMNKDHLSNPVPEAALDLLRTTTGLALNIGAGATRAHEVFSHCVELESVIFRNTDVIGDAHHLPFGDDTFDTIVSLNTFEHLAEPTAAAREIFRVLKPGGQLLIQTAFMQPLHEEPYHYYNATKYGVLRWFSDFEIAACRPSENFSPALMLAWLVAEVLWHAGTVLGPEQTEVVARATLSDFRAAWLDAANRNTRAWELLATLPEPIQQRFSGGFELRGRKPSSPPFVAPSALDEDARVGHYRRELERARAHADELERRLLQSTAATPATAHLERLALRGLLRRSKDAAYNAAMQVSPAGVALLKRLLGR